MLILHLYKQKKIVNISSLYTKIILDAAAAALASCFLTFFLLSIRLIHSFSQRYSRASAGSAFFPVPVVPGAGVPHFVITFVASPAATFVSRMSFSSWSNQQR
jgi:hypothetical protein